MKTLKKGKVTEDLEKMKRSEARDLGVQDFFNKRDKSARGSQGLIEDSSKVLGEETKIKQELFDASMNVNNIPSHIVPLFSGVFLTARRNKLMENGLYLPTASFGKGTDTDMDVDFSDTQIVLACGPNANQVSPGMEVVINMDNFKKRLESSLAQKLNKEFEYILPIENIEGVEYLYLTERDIKYISNTNMISINQIT
jgi:hypothetical protein